MKYCIYCGYELKGGESSCPNCKKVFPVKMSKPESEQTKHETEPPKDELKQINEESKSLKDEPEQINEKSEPLKDEPKQFDEKPEKKMEQESEKKKNNKSEKTEKEKNKTLIFLVIVVICVAAAAAAILAGKNHKANKLKDTLPETAVEDDNDQEFINNGLPNTDVTEDAYSLEFAEESIELTGEGVAYMPALNTNIPDLSEIHWESSDPSVAVVDENGQVTAVAAGTAVITASWNDLTAFCEVTCDIAAAIHEYEFIIADCTWVEAKQDCLDRGGYLINIDSQEEYDYILNKIQEQNMQDKVFYLGGGRSIDSNVYYWISKDNQFTGEALNGNDSTWCSGNWMANEPSYRDGDTIENIMTMFFYKGENRWVWNDAPNDITTYYSGKTGYICEYEN